MDLGLKNKNALVLGAGGGLGGAIAQRLHAAGARVALAGRSAESLQDRARRISPDGDRLTTLVWDLADLESIDNNVRLVEESLGRVDILVNNTGGPPPTPVRAQEIEIWTSYFQSMVLSVIAITDRVLPNMVANQWGRVITSVSSGVIAPIPNLGLSNALRSTLVGWSKTLAREVGREGVTSNLIVPGRIATDRIVYLDQAKAEREGRSVESVTAESTSTIALGRYGDPEEYANVAAFLASEAASYVTGSTIRVDGGLIPSV